MSQELSNLDQLTDKIYHEGVEKANLKADEILREAESQKQKIIHEARLEAERMIASAKKASLVETKSAESEIRLKGKQLISDLKSEIVRLLRLKVIDSNVQASFSDQAFLQSLILEIVSYWKSDEELELILPEKLRGKVDKAFEKNIVEQIDGITISFNKQIANGFRISRQSDTYDITFSEDDFIELFSGYLKEKTRTFLFTEQP
ncbi:V-type ATP synthase subunit E [Fulvivirga sp. M361]|uniref:V-type ATP synthase subunit E n=1 Tax=Fulvivirga sp. M361 TaxID=2594266 RepID=UPI00117B641D|nr:V-type ATP synthase subunit E [Fulvivirga sp. M361]TRX60670.1 V-type ATP synthase subunit E [Fulvivirga sp. M361]